MALISDLLARNLSQPIEEIVKVGQVDEEAVANEITEYVVTDRISDQYRIVLKAMADAPASPDEGVGIWVSGFFGSGKSSFAKTLGYILANRTVLGVHAADRFKGQVADQRVHALIDSINARIPTEVVMFDVTAERRTWRSNERIAEIMYAMLLRHLKYADDFEIAELEISLEGEGSLDEFRQRCEARFKQPWETVRKSAHKHARASAILHELEPDTYPSADSWAKSDGARDADISITRFVQRAFDLTERRQHGKALAFVIDEVGAHVARSADKIEDLRAVVEQLGLESRNRVRAHKAVAPIWVVVTSQEKLDEVVAAIDSRRVELARLQDRFKYRVDLSPADIREVATRRVLGKNDLGIATLRKLYGAHQGQINTACRLERTTRASAVSEQDFVDFYPYLPHYVELSIDIVSGIRLQPGAPKHVGGSNRTIIKQAYEMLVSERTALADRPVGMLVTLDRVFELVEGNLSSEKQHDISDIGQRFKADLADAGWTTRVARAISLLEFVRDLPRTPANIAAVLVDRVGQPQPLKEVEAALARLVEAQFIRETEEGFKLQTAQEKSWETERRSLLSPSPREYNVIKREVLADIFGDARIRTYRAQHASRTFRIGVTVDGERVGDEGEILLVVRTAESPSELADVLDQARADSHQTAHANEIFWVLALSPDVDELVGQLHASRQMVSKYEQAAANNRITNDEAALLAAEKQGVPRIQSRLRDKLVTALQQGSGVFRGLTKDGSALGQGHVEMLKALLDELIPELYPKLPLGAISLKGNEAEEILRAANLSGLPQLFFEGSEGSPGLGLVVKEGTRWAVSPSAAIAREILGFLGDQQSYGNRVTGRDLEQKFGGVGYGWERDILRLVLATLLRAGVVEVTYQGRRFRDHRDPQCRVPFAGTTAFRTASFAGRQSIGLKTLTMAVEAYEALTGGEVDVEEAAIAQAFKKLADDELRLLSPLEATARAHRLPSVVLAELEAYRANLQTIQAADSDDCVRILAGEGTSFQQSRERIARLRAALDDQGVATLSKARLALDQTWPALAALGEAADSTGAASDAAHRLGVVLDSADLAAAIPALAATASTVQSAYCAVYGSRHGDRYGRAASAIGAVQNDPDWSTLSEAVSAALLKPLRDRRCTEAAPDLAETGLACRRCGATIGQMESDVAALPALVAEAVRRLRELVAPSIPTRQVRLTAYFPASVDPPPNEVDREQVLATLDEAVHELREGLRELVESGVRIVFE